VRAPVLGFELTNAFELIFREAKFLYVTRTAYNQSPYRNPRKTSSASPTHLMLSIAFPEVVSITTNLAGERHPT